jgi:hypothetical protein
MIITKLPQKPVAKNPPKDIDEAALAKFIDAASDAAPAAAEAPSAAHDRKVKRKGRQAQITFALSPELLDKDDHMAGSLSISRAAFVKQALTRAVNAEAQ